MNKQSISQFARQSQRNDFNEILIALADFYDKSTKKIIYHLYEKFNYSYADIGKILGISRQTIRTKYPKPEKEKKT